MPHCHFQASLAQEPIVASTKLPLTTCRFSICLVTQKTAARHAIRPKPSGSLPTPPCGCSTNCIGCCRSGMPPNGHAFYGRCLLGWKKARWGKRPHGAAGKMPLVAALSLAQRAPSVSHTEPDRFAFFPGITQAQCDHEPIIASNAGKRDDRPVFQWLITVLDTVKNVLHGNLSRHERYTLAPVSCRIALSFQAPVPTAHRGESAGLRGVANPAGPSASAEAA